MEFGESGAELTIDQSAATTQEIDPADYQVRVTAQSKSNGTISLHVTKAPEKEDPVEKARKDTEAKAEEAAGGAGFDSVPNLYGVKTSLGVLGVRGRELTYESDTGIVLITCPVIKDKTRGKILVTIGRVLTDGGAYSGKISFDNNNGGPNWEMKIEGLEETVTCYGDNKGDTPKVTKAGWENDDFKYEIRVESDDNSISLNEKDVETLIKAIMGSEETEAPDQTNQQQE